MQAGKQLPHVKVTATRQTRCPGRNRSHHAASATQSSLSLQPPSLHAVFLAVPQRPLTDGSGTGDISKLCDINDRGASQCHTCTATEEEGGTP